MSREKVFSSSPWRETDDLGSRLSGLCCLVTQTHPPATEMIMGSLLLDSKAKHTEPELLHWWEEWAVWQYKILCTLLEGWHGIGGELPPSNSWVVSATDVHWTQICSEQALLLHVSKQTAMEHRNEWLEEQQHWALSPAQEVWGRSFCIIFLQVRMAFPSNCRPKPDLDHNFLLLLTCVIHSPKRKSL